MSPPVRDNSFYRDGNQFTFMSTENYEQYTIDESLLGDKSHFLKEGTIVTTMMLEKNRWILPSRFCGVKVTKSDIATRNPIPLPHS